MWGLSRIYLFRLGLHFVPGLQSAVSILYLVCILYPVCSLQSAACSLRFVLTVNFTYPDSDTIIPRVSLTSWVNEPSNSRICFGPKRFLYLLHWPITRIDDDFKRHTPLKSMPLSFGPPQAATSTNSFLKLWTTISSNCRPNSCLEVDEHVFRMVLPFSEYTNGKIRRKNDFILIKQ